MYVVHTSDFSYSKIHDTYPVQIRYRLEAIKERFVCNNLPSLKCVQYLKQVYGSTYKAQKVDV